MVGLICKSSLGRLRQELPQVLDQPGPCSKILSPKKPKPANKTTIMYVYLYIAYIVYVVYTHIYMYMHLYTHTGIWLAESTEDVTLGRECSSWVQAACYVGSLWNISCFPWTIVLDLHTRHAEAIYGRVLGSLRLSTLSLGSSHFPGFAKKSNGFLRSSSETSIVILDLGIVQYEACASGQVTNMSRPPSTW